MSIWEDLAERKEYDQNDLKFFFVFLKVCAVLFVLSDSEYIHMLYHLLKLNLFDKRTH